MIVIFNAKGNKLSSFQNNNELFSYIRHLENLKKLDPHYFMNANWSFDIFTPEEVYELYHKMRKESVTEMHLKAYGHQLGLIEICEGDFENPTRIPMISDLDLDRLKKDWCLSYCKAHGYILIENGECVPVSKARTKREDN